MNAIKRFVAVGVVALAAVMTAVCGLAADFYVAKVINGGDDKNSGTKDAPFNRVAGICALALALLMVLPRAVAAADEWPVLKSYTGDHLRCVKMPLGGIGTGTISLSGTGALVDWEIAGRPNKGFTPSLGGFANLSPFFAVRTETADGEVTARILEGPVDAGEYQGGQSGASVRNHGFVRWCGCTFKTAYPLAQVALEDETMPVRATLEAMNPLLPGDADASGIPAALLRWKISNVSTKPLKASVACFLVNPVQGGKIGRIAQDGLFGLRFGTEGADEVDLVLAQGCGEIASSPASAGTHWMSGYAGFWRKFLESGHADGQLPSVSVAFELKPGETKALPFALAWRFPHRTAWAKTEDGKPVDVGNWYATRYPSAFAAAQDLLTNLVRYERGTIGFVRSVLAKKAPAVVKEAALFNLSTLRTETCFRTADGHFFGWEGCFDKEGVCAGNCSHVWGYEHVLIDLWPTLAKDMTELYFGPAMDERGCIKFRIALPLDRNAKPPRWAAADGQMQCIVKAYENWRKTGDGAWMRKLYPRIRKAMEFAWIPNGWDGDRDGVMEGSQHNTMDVEYFGPNPQMEFLYLAALKAMAALADGADDAAFAAECRALAAKGSAWTEKNLFNGAYYEHRVVPMKAAPAEGTYPRNVPDPSAPVYQLEAGCLVDQLVGDYASRAVGLGPVADEGNARKALETILAKNAGAATGGFNHMRSFAMPDEPSLRMAWYPKGRLPRHPFPYYTETMTGFEYVVAANLAQRGDFARAERVVRDIRSRFDGRKRNPFDETECGHHYARALAAWSVLQAFDAPALAVETDAVTGGIRELRIAGDESGMSWVRRADGVEFKWIGPEYMWGTGTLKVDGRPTAWSRASALGSNVVYRIDGGLEVSCARRNEDGSLYERYSLRNGGARAVKLSEIDIHTPFRDDYLPSGELRARRCHAHVWPGGSGAWVCAMRMGGAAPHLGLAVVEGRITGYELKERALEKGMSNTRGVIALSLPDVTLAPGEETAVAWRVFPHRGREDFLERVRGFGGVTASAPDWTVDARHPVEVTFRSAKGDALDGAEIVGEGVAVVGTRREGTSLVATCAYRKDGEARVRCRLRSGYETFAELLCRGDPDALVRARAAFIVRNQVYRGATADDPRDGALVEYDNETNAQYRRWEHSAAERLEADHNEGAERVAMGVFLARLAAAGHREYLPVVKRYARFVRKGLQDPDYTTWGEVDRNSRRRLYNYPWVAEFQVAAYRATGDRRHLLDAYGTLMRSFAQLKTLVLVESPEAEVFRALAEAGCRDESAKLLAAMRAHKDAVMARSSCTEEVNFAPEMVAGELTQFLDLWHLTGEDKYRRYALERILPMFEVCLGPQPSWHSHDIGMHHWDGYWFGKRRCWGDTLPHDWNGTGADVFARLADATGDAAYRVRARAVVRQLLGLFDADGRAGCAWVLPDRVNGRPARFRDPLANDQDWALVFYLRNGRGD